METVSSILATLKLLVIFVVGASILYATGYTVYKLVPSLLELPKQANTKERAVLVLVGLGILCLVPIIIGYLISSSIRNVSNAVTESVPYLEQMGSMVSEQILPDPVRVRDAWRNGEVPTRAPIVTDLVPTAQPAPTQPPQASEATAQQSLATPAPTFDAGSYDPSVDVPPTPSQ